MKHLLILFICVCVGLALTFTLKAVGMSSYGVGLWSGIGLSCTSFILAFILNKKLEKE